jgi:cytochrome c peroxidase
LGEVLFHDSRLSRGGVVACVSCHRLDQGGDDQRERPSGIDGRPLDFNSPTLFNVALNFRLNWRGNFRTLEEQNEAVLLDPRVMATTWDELLAKLRADPDYDAAFAAAYGAQPERASVLDALAVFQRSLATPNARFDLYLRGRREAITAAEERGYRLFTAFGCIACHQGQNVGGNLFQKFGIFSDPFAGGANVTKSNLGRFTITHRDRDRHVFRVPSLRNVAATAPYFHDGRTASLAEAVEVMARSQLGRELRKEDVQAIVQFLGTLTGEYRGRPLADQVDAQP